jgi:hypothetical protein
MSELKRIVNTSSIEQVIENALYAGVDKGIEGFANVLTEGLNCNRGFLMEDLSEIDGVSELFELMSAKNVAGRVSKVVGDISKNLGVDNSPEQKRRKLLGQLAGAKKSGNTKEADRLSAELKKMGDKGFVSSEGYQYEGELADLLEFKVEEEGIGQQMANAVNPVIGGLGDLIGRFRHSPAGVAKRAQLTFMDMVENNPALKAKFEELTPEQKLYAQRLYGKSRGGVEGEHNLSFNQLIDMAKNKGSVQQRD